MFAHIAKVGFFPLDEELSLLSGSLSPHVSELVTRLGARLPFAEVAELMVPLCGVDISANTARRHTQATGAALIQSEEQELKVLLEPAKQNEEPSAVVQNNSATNKTSLRLVAAVDGVMVGLRHKEWSEVKTLVIGTPTNKEQKKSETKVDHLSYFSRLTNSEDFAQQATLPTERRGLLSADKVTFVTDGAEWIQGFIDLHRVDALRILDFPHAAEYVNEIGQLVYGKELPAEWLGMMLHNLKHQGGAYVVAELEKLVGQITPMQEELNKKLCYLQKRQGQMNYPEYLAQGWPIGSGMVESANKTVVEARLKGAGMHWERGNVNPMLGLRDLIANKNWEEGWQQSVDYRREKIRNRCIERGITNTKSNLIEIKEVVVVESAPEPPVIPSRPKLVVGGRPTQGHPWRRPFLLSKPSPINLN